MFEKLLCTLILLLSTGSLQATIKIPQKKWTLNTRIIVKFKHLTKSLLPLKSTLQQTMGMPLKKLQPIAGGAFVASFDNIKNLSSSQFQTQLAQLKNRSDVIYAVKDKIGYFVPVPEATPSYLQNELTHDIQWDEFSAPAGVFLESASGKVDGAWSITKGQGNTTPVVVAVLDTGVEKNPDLMANITRNPNNNLSLFGWNFAGNNSDVSDETGGYHGTHVAGTIAANGPRVFGMGPALKILPVKIPDASGMFYESAVINGLHWAVGDKVPGVPTNPYPAKVINMSFGIDERPGKEVDFCDEAAQDAVNFAIKKGAVLVVAAGNNNRENDLGAPAGCKGTVRVASTGPNALRAYYSNYGKSVSYAAPGGDKMYGEKGAILSTVKPGHGVNGSGLDFYQGTSMASPHVAGIAALLFAAGSQYQIDNKKVKTLLYSTTHGFGKEGNSTNNCINKSCGHGIVDANNGVKAAVANYNVIINAPALKKLALKQSKACIASALTSRAQIKTKMGVWQRETKTTCISASTLPFPRLTIQKNNVIAHYGEVRYRLHHTYRHCEVIGIDGVGCYR